MDKTALEVGFVAALEREVAAVVRGWSRESVWASGWACQVYLDPARRAALVCAGMGAERAYEAAKLLAERYAVKTLVSIGFAGACTDELQPGALVVPARVVEAASGREYACALGQGTLVSVRGLASVAAKREVRARHGALAVEMEAAGVAAAAAKYETGFAAIKAVSDGAAEELEFLAAFTTPQGFDAGRFLAYAALRPALWPRVARLHRSSKLAAAALAEAAAECMADWQAFAARHGADAGISRGALPGAAARCGRDEGRSA